MMRKISKALFLGCVAAAIHIASTQGWASSSASGGAPLPIDDPPPCTGIEDHQWCYNAPKATCNVQYGVYLQTTANKTRTKGLSISAPECLDNSDCLPHDTHPALLGCK